MTSPLLLVPSLLIVVLACPWNSNALRDQENILSSGQEEQSDAIPHPSGEFCQRNKNPKGLGFIGVKYDLLRGNPEGMTSLGGADPGLESAKKILKLTNDNGNAVPDQICYEERQLCSTSKSSKIFGGTKRYQEKLSVDVTAKAHYSGLFDFSFTFSKKYENIKRTTKSGETVFRDCTEICNKGEARYQLGSVESNQWTLTEEFATDVCQLPSNYRTADKKKYFHFLETWGTHVVIQVVLGTKKITRFRSTLKEFMTYASKNVGNSISVSGGYGGTTGTVSVDINQFEESEESNKDFGERQLTYTIGGDDLPEPIRLKLMAIEETLKPKFWSNLDELKRKSPCKRMSLTKLQNFLQNMRKTIKDYPSKLGAKRATDNPMELQLSWPSGYYSLFTARKDGNNVCPQQSGFQWQSGSVTDQNHGFGAATKKELIGIQKHIASAEWDKGIKYGFCTKTQDPGNSYFTQDWPSGKYCILRKSIDPGNPKCPKNFEVASVVWNDDWTDQVPDGFLRGPVKEGTYPDGSFESNRHLKIEFCCRQDGFVATGIHLPVETAAQQKIQTNNILYSTMVAQNVVIFEELTPQGYSCQKVCGAQVTPFAVRTGALTPLLYAPDSAIHGNVKPAGMTSKQEVELRFCHYQKMDDANFIKIQLIETPMKARTAERECRNRGGHLVSIHSQEENQIVKDMVGTDTHAWIGLHRRTEQNRPWVWYDDTELDFGEWRPDVTDDENYVSLSKDGSWIAMNNDNKLPFVCKVINRCPLNELELNESLYDNAIN